MKGDDGRKSYTVGKGGDRREDWEMRTGWKEKKVSQSGHGMPGGEEELVDRGGSSAEKRDLRNENPTEYGVGMVWVLSIFCSQAKKKKSPLVVGKSPNKGGHRGLERGGRQGASKGGLRVKNLHVFVALKNKRKTSAGEALTQKII